MTKGRIVLGGAAVIAVAVLVGLLEAQAKGMKDTDEPRAAGPRDVTVAGTLVDLHCYMTQPPTAKTPEDQKKLARECLSAGVPAALETADGLLILGKGAKGAGRDLAAMVLEPVEIKGKLYERHGVRYVDVMSVKPAALPQPEDADVDDEYDEQDWEPEPATHDSDDSDDWE